MEAWSTGRSRRGNRRGRRCRFVPYGRCVARHRTTNRFRCSTGSGMPCANGRRPFTTRSGPARKRSSSLPLAPGGKTDFSGSATQSSTMSGLYCTTRVQLVHHQRDELHLRNVVAHVPRVLIEVPCCPRPRQQPPDIITPALKLAMENMPGHLEVIDESPRLDIRARAAHLPKPYPTDANEIPITSPATKPPHHSGPEWLQSVYRQHALPSHTRSVHIDIGNHIWRIPSNINFRGLMCYMPHLLPVGPAVVPEHPDQTGHANPSPMEASIRIPLTQRTTHFSGSHVAPDRSDTSWQRSH